MNSSLTKFEESVNPIVKVSNSRPSCKTFKRFNNSKWPYILNRSINDFDNCISYLQDIAIRYFLPQRACDQVTWKYFKYIRNIIVSKKLVFHLRWKQLELDTFIRKTSWCHRRKVKFYSLEEYASSIPLFGLPNVSYISS